MPQRRNRSRDRYVCLALALVAVAGSPIYADEPAEEREQGLTLQAPLNSTFQLRPPRRDWEQPKPAPTARRVPEATATPGPDPAEVAEEERVRTALKPKPADDGWVARDRSAGDRRSGDVPNRGEETATEMTWPDPKSAEAGEEIVPDGEGAIAAGEAEQEAAGEADPGIAGEPKQEAAGQPERDAVGEPASDSPGEPDQEAWGDADRGDSGDAAANAPGGTRQGMLSPADPPSLSATVPLPGSASRDGDVAATESPARETSAAADPAPPVGESPGERRAERSPGPLEVRKLRIGIDGSLQDGGSDPVRSRADVPDGRRNFPSTRVGDMTVSPDTSADVSARRRAEQPGPDEVVSETESEALSVRRDYTGRIAQPIRLSDGVRRMEPTLRGCLEYYLSRPENASARSNWGMMHAIMVYGVDTPIVAGRERHNAIAWIAGNNACRGKRLLAAGPGGIRATEGVGLQGHQGQFLAVLGMVGVPADYPLYVGTRQHSVRDLVETEARACRSGEELTFTLIGLSHYLDTDDSWTTARGERWDFERLIREELSQPIVGAACGGTHRLMGFGHALRKRRAAGKPITGQWARADQFTEEFIEYAYTLQNRDGSMSTQWFEGREDNGNLDRKIQTTGHIVEWLLTVTPDDELQDPRLVRAVQFLLTAMNRERNRDWAIGPKGHALRALAMYYQRIYDAGPAWQSRLATGRSVNRSGNRR